MRSNSADRAHAADTAARALAEGFAPEASRSALSLAANGLLLHDPGRTTAEPGKPIGSVHGASIGVHASDAANAWRHIAASGARVMRSRASSGCVPHGRPIGEHAR